MKYLHAIIASTLILASCGGEKKTSSIEDVINSGNLKEIRAKKKEIETSQEEINAQIETLVAAINKYNTEKKIPLITTITPTATVFNHYVELQGSVNTKKNILVYPETPGIIRTIKVDEGDYVRKGQLLAVVSDGGISDQISQLEIQTELTKTIFERQKKLWEQKIGSEIEFLQAQATYLANINSIKQLKAQLDKTRIVAPFNGVIDDIFKEPGTVVAPGQGSEIFRVVNLTDMYIDTEVPESYISTVVKGKHVEVYFPILHKTVEAKVTHAASHVNPANRTFRVEVKVPNKNQEIKPNLTAKVKINDYINESAILIPQSIISENSKGEQYIYTVVDKKENGEATVHKQTIETGKTQGDVIEVLTVFPNGLEIIKEGARSVTEGQTVKILENESLKL